MHHIYIIQNDINLKIYIGQSIRPKSRWRSHKNCARSVWMGTKTIKDHGIQVIHLALAKYGFDKFTFQVIESFESQEEVNDAEEFWIQYFQSRSNKEGYNVVVGGVGVGCGPNHPLYGKPAHNRLFTKEQEREICNKYSGKMIPITKLGKMYNCTESCIFNILKRNDIKTLGNAVFSKGKHHSPETEFKKGQEPHNKLFTDEQETEICKQHVNGSSTVELGKIYGCHKSVISRLLIKNDVEMRDAGYYAIGKFPPNKLFTDEQEKEICDKYIENIRLTITAIAKIYSCDRSVISDILDKHKIAKRSRNKLTDTQKEIIREEHKIIKSSLKLAKKYSVSKTTILNVLKEAA